MKVVEAIPFFNELDLLEIHLKTHWRNVDTFFVTESMFSHTGKPKPLFLSNSPRLLGEFAEKLVVQVIEEKPEVTNAFEADWFHRESAKKRLSDILDDDSLLLYSDVDEIVRPQALEQGLEILKNDSGTQIVHFAQDLTYFFLNNVETSGKLLSYTGEYEDSIHPKWLGSNLSRWSFARQGSLTSLRNPEHKSVGKRVDNAGWHFSWVGGPQPQDPIERVIQKLENTAHQEFDTWFNRWGLRRRIEAGRDLVRRRGGRFRIEEDLAFLPQYVQDNLSKFDSLIYRRHR
jgi:beta-1,4-mannosyl-glycoprotein beta-1,4-N-acetylglucosaminyltransferase